MMVSNTFYFHPYLGKIPNLTNIFQRGWNHQLVLLGQMGFETILPNFGLELLRKWKLSGGPYRKFLDLLT